MHLVVCHSVRDCEIARGRSLAAANLVLGEADIMRDVAESPLNMTISDHLAKGHLLRIGTACRI